MPIPRDCSRDEWPLKAYKNLDFLNSSAGRHIRVLCEMVEPKVRFADAGIKDTIVLFGSARLRSQEASEEALREAEKAVKDPANPTAAEASAIDYARTLVNSAPYFEAAADLAESLTKWSMTRKGENGHRFTICSGGGPGIMEAANLGAARAGGESIGLGISLPMEQGVNHHVTEDLKFEFHYFFVRKYWFVSMAKALVAFPGGYGTLDELFETLTLIQTGKVEDKPPIVLFGSEFWNEVVNFEALVKWGTISKEDVDLFRIVDTVEEAEAYIVECLEQRFADHPETLLQPAEED